MRVAVCDAVRDPVAVDEMVAEEDADVLADAVCVGVRVGVYLHVRVKNDRMLGES